MEINSRYEVLSAADVGANHQRERIWIVARQRNIFSHTEHNWNGWRKQQQESIKKENGAMAHTQGVYSNGSTIYRKHSESEVSELRNSGCTKVRDTNSQDVERQRKISIGIEQKLGNIGNASWWNIEPELGGEINGLG